jgi:nudix-type nucleoside diphosphatase (YffH/AdpP family)
MNKHVKIINEKEVFNYKIFRIVEADLQHELYSGEMSKPIIRLSLDRGDSVAMLIHNAQSDTVILTEQFRYPTYHAEDKNKSGWLIEIPAGMIEPGEDPDIAISREVREETGYEVNKVQYISTFYLSPGGTSERIVLYYARVNPKQKLQEGGGVESEGEDIRIIEMKFQDILHQITTGQIADAKTIIALQWLQIKRLT